MIMIIIIIIIMIIIIIKYTQMHLLFSYYDCKWDSCSMAVIWMN